MRILIAIVCTAAVFALASEAAAQGKRRNRPAPQKKVTQTPTQTVDQLPVLPDIRNDPDVQDADIAIIANITAKELRFEVVPDPKVEFLDKARNLTIWQAERFSLPDKIEPGVTYRNIGIRLKITSRLADIERIVAEALGEVPISDATVPEAGPPKPMPAPAGDSRPQPQVQKTKP